MKERKQLRLLKSIVIVILISLHLSCVSAPKKLEITNIATEGFLLESGGKKVLIDALFGKKELNFTDVPSVETLNKMLASQAPFDNVNLLLVTHQHVDHFDASLVAEYLENNKHCNLIGPQQVVDKIMEFDIPSQVKERIHSITPPFGQSENITFDGVKIIVLRLKHLAYLETDEKTGEKVNHHKNMQNLGFLINLENYTMLHVGDSSLGNGEEYKLFSLAQKEIDIAFLGTFWEPYEPKIEIINKYIKPQNIILMHLDKGDKDKYFTLKEAYQDILAPITIFKNELEKKEFSK